MDTLTHFLQQLAVMGVWIRGQFDAILAGIVSSTIVITFGQMYGWGRPLLGRVQSRRIWRLKGARHIRIVSATFQDADRAVISSAPTTWPDANAASRLIDMTRSLYPRAEIAHDFKAAEEEFLNTLVSVGGPVYNRATDRLMQSINRKCYFELAGETNSGEKYYRFVTSQGMSFTPVLTDKNVVTTDYGIIIRMINPLAGDGRVVLLVLGCETFGVLASALVLAGDSVAGKARRQLLKALPLTRSTEYLAVFRCEPLGTTVGAIHMEHFEELNAQPIQASQRPI